ncbi:hypothetical protein JXB01_02300 [Candidatus Micrarchaeota archaeon]|nr:hypothetical protein [Candidatus Micrarchaeota archaeon]
MIVGGKVVAVEGTKDKEEAIKGLNINIGFEEIEFKGENIDIKYTYVVTYNENVGQLKITGYLYLKEDKKKVKEIEEGWKKNKKMPEEYAASLLTAINYSGSANGTLIARVLNLSPPLVPPRLELPKQ